MSGAAFGDFTETAYREVVAGAADRFAFEPFGTKRTGPHAIWRHDVDFSVHRAARLAEIEADLGVRATYFFRLHGDFYSLLEASTLERVRHLISLGHWVGLHFEPDFHLRLGAAADETALVGDRELLMRLVDVPVTAVSVHNPTLLHLAFLEAREVAGMVSADSIQMRETYTYTSDSNGYWRFRPLWQAVADPRVTRLHALTHPEWWQAEAMPPRARVARCIDGRAAAVAAAYDKLLAGADRVNVAIASELPSEDR